MKKILALMCVGALVMGLTTGFDAEAKAKRIRSKKIAKTEKVAKVAEKTCDKACDDAKAECKDAKACDKKVECKDAKACDKKVECKEAKACDKAQMKGGKKQLFGKNKADKMQLKEFKGKAECKGEKACDKAKADCKDCEKKGECDHKSPCCKEGACKKDASCGKEKCKANPEACCK